MPNTVAYAALLLWPFAALCLFVVQRNLERAIIWSVVASFLLLPSSFSIDLPGVPPLDKVTVPNAMLLLLVVLIPNRPGTMVPKSHMARLLLVALLVGPFFTAMFNPDGFWVGERALRGMTSYDALSNIVAALLMLVPFLVGYAYLATPNAHREILRALVVAGLGYSLLMLFEVRMSPQLHTWLYGYFPHSFGQQIRFGGFRPVVFLEHGLWTAFFAMTIFIAAAVLWRDAREDLTSSRNEVARRRAKYGWSTGYFSVVLVLCKSLASLLYAVLLLPLVALARPKTQIAVASLLVLAAIAYPALRGAGLVPVETIHAAAESLDSERAQSLRFRLDNEDALLARAAERPIFGWGTWGRNRVYDEWSGKDKSVTDGYWIIRIGSYGWTGFLAFFGLLALPVLAVRAQARRPGGAVPGLPTTGLCLLLAINMIELLPNATLPPWSWLIAGAVLGYAERRQTAPVEQPAKAIQQPRRRTVL